MFLSTFVSAAMNFGNFDNFDGQVRSQMFRAIGGMVLIVIGQIVRGIGARGLAGSGVVLDPEKAREDLQSVQQDGGRHVWRCLRSVRAFRARWQEG